MKHMVPAGNISKVAVEEVVHALSWLLAWLESVGTAPIVQGTVCVYMCVHVCEGSLFCNIGMQTT